MSQRLSLSVTTPLRNAVTEIDVVSLRGEDQSGGFGILPGHADFVTVIYAGVLRWRCTESPWRFCAVRGGVFTVTAGQDVRVACREAIMSDDLPSLEDCVAAARRAGLEEGRQARSHDAKLHARAIRRLMQGLALGGDTLGLDGEEEA